VKKNPFYLHLTTHSDRLEACLDGMTPEEAKNDKITFCIVFMTIDRIASSISREELGLHSSIVLACVALSYTDIYLLTEMMINDLELTN
jgi:hypothetical protein